MSERTLVRVAVPVPLPAAFDYYVPLQSPVPAPGTRVRVPFGRRDQIGVVIAHPAESALEAAQIKTIRACLDESSVLSPNMLELLQWAARYYHHPIGEVIASALPQWLREGRPSTAAELPGWQLTDLGREQDMNAIAARAPRQGEALTALAASPWTSADLRARGIAADVLQRLAAKGWIAPATFSPAHETPPGGHTLETPPTLSPDQALAVATVRAQADGFKPYLLHGVTGSGKTEVYLQLIRDVLEAGRQALLLVPEIGLTPQLVSRLERRFGGALAVLHSGLTDKERFLAWVRARSGAARLVVGTRSAIFAELPDLALIVVDEEHDASFKQQTGFRYSARDLAIVRAQREDIRVLLGSATPSLETLHNARAGRYGLLELPQRIGTAGQPDVRVIDMNHYAQHQGLSTPLLERMTEHLSRGHQVILFLNRRGFAPALFCSNCAQVQACSHCDANMTIHARAGKLRCHHCGRESALHWRCPKCEGERIAVGAGTQRVSDELRALLPDYTLATLDRDSTARVGALDTVLDDVASGKTDILVGTQMLTKGHDFPNVTLVGVLNADQGLFGTDFRAEERLAQTILQVAGRAGRRAEAGEVLIQTHYPGHPLLERLLAGGYAAFAELALRERERAHWPPFAHVAAIRAESEDRKAVFSFLGEVRTAVAATRTSTQIFGPAAAAMERKSGRYRGQLVLQSAQRGPLHASLDRAAAAIYESKLGRRVRWAIDVDPVEV
jgi:primosomal protein N' (replication factor Y)